MLIKRGNTILLNTVHVDSWLCELLNNGVLSKNQRYTCVGIHKHKYNSVYYISLHNNDGNLTKYPEHWFISVNQFRINKINDIFK